VENFYKIMDGQAMTQLNLVKRNSCRSLRLLILMNMAALWGMISLADADDKLICESSPISWQADAELTDVFFLNADTGWAVGAQGVILRTTNGGREWKEVGQVDTAQVVQELSLQQKVEAMQNGVRTQVTGVADGRADHPQKYRCRFESVFFVDERNGWVAGGVNVPYLDHSRGVLLRTADGGATWRRVNGALMPRIKRVYFLDRSRGWAVGECGKLFKGCLFYTQDGGESWSNQTDPKTSQGTIGYLDGDISERGYVAIDSSGQPVLVRNDREEVAAIEGRGAAFLKKVRMTDGHQGWSVGEQGAVWRTTNGGLSWSALDEDPKSPTNQLFREFDFQALSVSPTKIWFAGNPGTQIFSIDRISGEILSYSTGLPVPINAVHFIDDQVGWCVGALGTVLSTTDGGISWQRLRGRHRSVAILGVAYDERELPFEALARFSSEEDYLMAVAMCQPIQSPASRQSLDRLGSSGFYSVAAKGANFSIQQEQECQLQRMVRLIRTLKPNVIVCDSEYRKLGLASHSQHAAFDPYVMLSAAISAAADRTAFPNQIELAKLEPWIVDRIAYRVPSGAITLEPQRLLIRLGHVLEDQIAISRGLNGLALSSNEKKSYRIEVHFHSLSTNHSDLLDGLSQTGRSMPKRAADNRLRTNRASIELANRKQQKILELAQFDAKTDQDLAIWSQKIQEWLGPVDEVLAGIWLAQLAERYLEQRKIELASKSLELLSTRYYGHALHAASLVWLARYYASDEFARLELDTIAQFRKKLTAATTAPTDNAIRVGQPSTKAYSSHQDGQTILVWAPVADKIELPQRDAAASEMNSNDPSSSQGLAPDVAAASHDDPVSAVVGSLGSGLTADEIRAFLEYRRRRASHYLTQLSQLDPDLINHLQFRFMEAGLKRKLGGNSMAEGTWKTIAGALEQRTGLSSAAKRELQLMGVAHHAEGTKWIQSQATNERPYLDGNLNDSVWQSVLQNKQACNFVRGGTGDLALGWSDQRSPVECDQILFAHDDEFLFIAVVCQKVRGQFYQTSKDRRSRDPDLSRRDRVEICFDLDRDYQSSFRFEVDYRGWCAEDLNGAKGWNPAWYVARNDDEQSWTLEMAIPLEALTATPLTGDEMWAIRLSRRLGDGVNLWKNSSSASSGRDGQELSQGLYQQIFALPNDFQLFTFR
jgi:photosystem II stability/assembly factor-like uncharacterized protein